ncbi:DUF3016 domain-containing protein [Actomonas aquatica]|uniref:DUF3016 domain-containing protein n=1 Tax=Actomonas aquatica TaxID=2866162 RepID=A0ABZ1C2J9_9BACT|nr:DUF3016 domain-containing protein [Opitutus sp. WL0086]WRQ85580.1 DUF3016 domain-containing protein [Opitutus sp. WL0086]
MKTSTFLAIFGLLAGAVAAEPASAVKVNFVDTDNFTDFTSSYSFPDRGRETYIKELSKFIERRAESRLPSDLQLEVVITDVDMAGEFEPWHGPNAQDIRIVKSLYPPRINLSFRLARADGTVVSEGNRKLRDMSFMYSVRFNDDDPLRYEKQLIDSWLRQELRGQKRT